MTKDIANEEDIKLVVDSFSKAVQKDEFVAPCFQHINWSESLPAMHKFWSSMLFRAGKFVGRPFPKHLAIQGLDEAHYNRISDIFNRAVNASFKGERAEILKMKVKQIVLCFQSRVQLVSDDD